MADNSNVCICLSGPEKVWNCPKCNFNFYGRLVRTCAAHTRHIGVLDQTCCPNCGESIDNIIDYDCASLDSSLDSSNTESIPSSTPPPPYSPTDPPLTLDLGSPTIVYQADQPPFSIIVESPEDLEPLPPMGESPEALESLSPRDESPTTSPPLSPRGESPIYSPCPSPNWPAAPPTTPTTPVATPSSDF